MRSSRLLSSCVTAAIALAAVFTASEPAPAAVDVNGTLDTSFRPGFFTNGQVNASVFQPDGKILIGGLFGKVNGVARRNVARLNSDGSLDESFNAGEGPDGVVNRILLQQDGKVIIIGIFERVSGIFYGGLARLNADGSRDLGHNPANFISGPSRPLVWDAVFQSSGKLVIVGPFATEFALGIARLNVDGSLDRDFNPGFGSDELGPTSVDRTPDDKLMIAGPFLRWFNGNIVPGVARLETDGGFDKTFTAPQSSPASNVDEVVVQSDGAVIITGLFDEVGGMARPGLARLNSNGALDDTFVPAKLAGYSSRGSVATVTEQSDGKLLICGRFHSADGAVAHGIVRLNVDGTRDSSFSGAGAGANGRGVSVTIRPSDGKLLFGGDFSSSSGVTRHNMALLSADGLLEGGFTPKVTDGSPSISALGMQSNGKIIVGGLFTSVDDTPRYNIVRLNEDGSVDPSFAVGEGASGSVRAILVLPNDKILLGGGFEAVAGQPATRVVLLNADGSIDPSFDTAANGPDDFVLSLTADSAGNVFIGGPFSRVGTTPRPKIAKLQPSGALDTAFDPGAGPIGSSGLSFVYALSPPDPTAGLVIGGRFDRYNSEASSSPVTRGVVAVNPTNAGEQLFTRQGGFNAGAIVRALTRSASGKYIVTGGNITSYDGSSVSRVVRLNNDGTLDPSFSGTGITNGSGLAAAARGSSVFVGGSFTGSSNEVARLTPAGSPDPQFSSGTGVEILAGSPLGTSTAPQVNAVAIDRDGKLLIGGLFNGYQGVARAGIARLTGPSVQIDSLNRTGESGMLVRGSGAPNRTYSLEATSDLQLNAFVPVAPAQTDGSGRFEFFHGNAGTKHFYRLRLE